MINQDELEAMTEWGFQLMAAMLIETGVATRDGSANAIHELFRSGTPVPAEHTIDLARCRGALKTILDRLQDAA